MEKGKLFSESIGEILHLQTHKTKIFLKLLFPVNSTIRILVAFVRQPTHTTSVS